MSGQAIVEAAIVMPIMLGILLAVVAVFYLDLSTRRMQNGIDVLAQLAARDPDWRGAVPDEDRRTGCHADPLMPAETRTDDRLLLRWSCHLETRWIFDGLPITVSSEVVLPEDEHSPVPS